MAKNASSVLKGFGVVSKAVGLGLAVGGLNPGHRQCTITISNHSSHSLINPRMYIESGHCTADLPREISSSEEFLVEFQKTPHTARGAVGVFTYELQDPISKSHTKQLAFMFSVPFDYGLYSNWHAGGFFGKDKTCDYDLFYEMYYNSENGFARQKGGCSISYSDGEFTVKATMTDTYTPVMTVEIHRVII